MKRTGSLSRMCILFPSKTICLSVCTDHLHCPGILRCVVSNKNTIIKINRRKLHSFLYTRYLWKVSKEVIKSIWILLRLIWTKFSDLIIAKYNHSLFVEEIRTSQHNGIRQLCKLISTICKIKNHLLHMIIFSSCINQYIISLIEELFYIKLKWSKQLYLLKNL